MEPVFRDTLFENAQRIFDVAQAGVSTNGADDNQDFALVIKPDGGLHFVMESPFSLDALAIDTGARSAFRVTRSRHGIRVEGHSTTGDCVLEQRNPCRRNPGQMLLRDQPLYRITSPLLTSASA